MNISILPYFLFHSHDHWNLSICAVLSNGSTMTRDRTVVQLSLCPFKEIFYCSITQKSFRSSSTRLLDHTRNSIQLHIYSYEHDVMPTATEIPGYK